MSICQECGKKTIILLGNATLGKWICDKCDDLVERGKLPKRPDTIKIKPKTK